jgi:predicted amidohydrolase
VTTASRRYPNGASVVVELFDCKNTWLELNTAVVVFNGKMIRCYYKKWNGGDTGGAETETVKPKALGEAAMKRIFATQHSVRYPTERIRTEQNQLVKVEWHFGVDIDDVVVSGSFTFRDVKIGVEICADADMEALRNDVEQTLDLHVVVSCDMENLAGDASRCAAIKNRGYLVQCDGNQLKFADHAKKSFKALRRDGLTYKAVAGKLCGDTLAGSIYVTELALD